MKRQIIKTKPRTCKRIEGNAFIPGHNYMISMKVMKACTNTCYNCNPNWDKDIAGIVFTVNTEKEYSLVRGYFVPTDWCVELVEDTKTKRG